MLLHRRLALITVTPGLPTVPVAVASQDRKADPEPEGLVERVIDAHVKVETARAKWTRRPLDPIAVALARVRDKEQLDRDAQELPADHPLRVAGRARTSLAGGILTRGFVKKARVTAYVQPGTIRLDTRGQLYLIYPSAGTKDAAVREVETYVAKAQEAYDRAKKGCPRLDPNALKVGQTGYFADEHYRPIAFRAYQVIDANAALLAHGGKLFWLDQRGHNLVDDAVFTSTARWEVSRTRQYRTRADEARTVYALEPDKP